MKAGFSSTDITPLKGVPIGGNMRDDSRSKGVHDPLKADVIVLETEKNKIILIDLDWVAADLDLMKRIKNAITKSFSVEYNNICISMTHTHSGPDVYAVINDSVLSNDTKKYVDIAIGNIIEGVKTALKNTREVLMGWGKGHEDSISFNRRAVMKDGTVTMNWEFSDTGTREVENIDRIEGTVDTEINILKICDNDGLQAVLINFSLHPAVLVGKDLLYSKDFIWGLEEELKRVYREDILIFYSNGAQGNINHINLYDKNQGRDWDEAERIGKILGQKAEAIINNIVVKPMETLSVLYEELELPRRRISKKEVIEAQRLLNDCKGEMPELLDGIPDEWYAQDLLKMEKEKVISEKVELQVIRIGDGVICTFPGEAFAEYGLELKKRSLFSFTLPFGITNQCAGYIPTPEAINKGMEGKTCHFSRFAPQAGDMIVDKLLDMVYRLDGHK